MARAKASITQQSFKSGVIDPEVFGNTGTDVYATSAAELDNVYVSPNGSVTRREGLEYIAATTNNEVARILRFEFSEGDATTEQVYLLVFTPGELKIYRSDTLQATITASPISSLTASQLQVMRFAQKDDTIILVHPEFSPIKINRITDTNWQAATLSLTNIPYYAFNQLSVTSPNASITASAISGLSVTITASSGVFSASHVGQLITVATGGVLFITEYVSSTKLRANTHVALSGTSIPSGDWELETGYEPVWSSTRGYPVSIAFFQQRLWFGGSKSRTQTVWASTTNDYFDFDLGTAADSDAISVTIDDTHVNPIRHLHVGRNLAVFTSGAEFYFQATGSVITPTSLTLQKATTHGCSNIAPMDIDGIIAFNEASQAAVRAFVFNDVEASYTAENISTLATSLIDSPVSADVRPATAEHPSNYLYLVNANGTIAVLSFLRSQKLIAWSTFSTQGSFEQVVVVGSEVYVVVKRNIAGVDVRYIEKFNPTRQLDSSLSATSGTATTTFTGFGPLDGEEIYVDSQGSTVAESAEVAGGVVTLTAPVTEIEGGLPFFAKVVSVPLDAVLGNTFQADAKRRVYEMAVNLHNSKGVIIQYQNRNYTIKYRKFGELFGATAPTITGFQTVKLSGYSNRPQVTITQNIPAEFTLLSFIARTK